MFIAAQTSVRTCGFALGDNLIFTSTDARMGNIAQLFVYDIRTNVADRTGGGGWTLACEACNFDDSSPIFDAAERILPACVAEMRDAISVTDLPKSRISAAAWGPLNKYIYAGHENGDIVAWDWQVRPIAGRLLCTP